jgi:polyhydroxyalkanoate synthase
MIAVLWIVLLAAALLLGTVAFYWHTLVSMHPEHLHTDEIYTLVTPDLWKLRVCRYRKGRTLGEPVVFVHGAGGNHHNYTEPPGNSLVAYLTRHGYDCWCIDLRGCRSSQPPFGRTRHSVQFDEYLEYDLPTFIAYVRKVTGYHKVHWVGHSMGGMLLYAWCASQGEDQIAAGITLGSPTGFDDCNLAAAERLHRLGRRMPVFSSNFARALIPFMVVLRTTGGFVPINFANMHPQLGIGNLFHIVDNILPGVMGALLHAAKTKTWTMLEGTVDVRAYLKNLRIPLLAFYAPRDAFVNLNFARAFVRELPHDDKRIVVLSRAEGCARDYDHIEMPFARDSKRDVFEPIVAWLQAHPARSKDTTLPVEPAEHVYTPPPQRHSRTDILSGSSFDHVVKTPPPRERDGDDTTVDTDPTHAAAQHIRELPVHGTEGIGGDRDFPR